MIDRIREVLVSQCRVPPGSLIVVGYSGGPDSTCLLDLLWRLNYALVVAHVDHGLRPDSQADADFARGRAEAYGLPFALSRQPVRSHSRREGLSVEDAARTLRYRFLFQVAHERSARAVAVGHNADDQVETVLMHILRGAGLAGFAGMRPRRVLADWSESLPLVRPLLTTWREEILAYCRDRELEVRIDSTNQDRRLLRNRIRHELIPYLEEYNPRLREGVWRSARALAGDLELVQEAVRQGWEAALLDQGEGFVRLAGAALRGQPVGVQRGVLRRAISVVRPDFNDIGYEVTERAVAFLASPPATAESDLAAGLRLLMECGHLVLAAHGARLPSSAWPQLPGKAALELPIPGRLELAEGWEIEAAEWGDVQTAGQAAQGNADAFQAWIDRGSLEAPLTLRPRKPGDRILPLGLGGHSAKVSDLMIDTGVPRRARAGWPIVCSGERIVWVPGCRLGEPFRLREDSLQVVHLRFFPGPVEAPPS